MDGTAPSLFVPTPSVTLGTEASTLLAFSIDVVVWSNQQERPSYAATYLFPLTQTSPK